MASACGQSDLASGWLGEGQIPLPEAGDGSYHDRIAECSEGTSRECVKTVAAHSGVLSCFHGQQFCVDGQWGACTDGTVSREYAPKRAALWTNGLNPATGQQVRSLSDAGVCANNPCDPYCQVYDEAPDAGVSVDGSIEGVDWNVGHIDDLLNSGFPSGMAAKGNTEPCSSGADCQFDQYCESPVTGQSCEHSKCSTGKSLDPSCDSCVGRICAQNPSCCGTNAPTGTCSHSVCDTGDALNKSCNSCVSQVCERDPSCCTNSCSHDICQTGSQLSGGCDSCVTDICATDPSCCIAACSPTAHGSHAPCSTGSRLERYGCDPGVDKTCAANESCCNTNCATHPATTGSSRLAPHCDSDNGSLVDQVCADDPTCCNNYAAPPACSGIDPCKSQYTGVRPVATCDSNIAEACAQNRSCCAATANNGATSCVHSPCTGSSTTAALASGCDADNGNIVAQVCASPGYNSCCTGKWTSSCVSKYIALAGIPGGVCQTTWNSTCVSLFKQTTGWSCSTSWSGGSSTSCRERYWAKAGLTSGMYQSSWTSTCVSTYQQQTGSSCGSTWSQSCVDKVHSVCNRSCPNSDTWSSQCVQRAKEICGTQCSGWDRNCIEKVSTVCGAFCAQDGTCQHDKCLEGGPLQAGCDSCVEQICQLDPNCCSTNWNAYCVAKVGSVCNINCQTGGQCTQWSPMQTNDYCPGVDLTIGVPCGNVIPVCNRGQSEVPANTVRLYHWPANSQQFPSLTPNLNHPQVGVCVVPEAIGAGSCVNATCPGLDDLRAVMVNPVNDPLAVSECSSENNWSLYKKDNSGTLSCYSPSCATAKTQASLATVNMFIMFDRSGSMCNPQSDTGCSYPGSTTRWGLTTGALKSFLKDPGSAGMRVGLRFFPDSVSGSDCSESTCSVTGCSTPLVPLAELLPTTDVTYPSNCAQSNDPQECALVKAINSRYPNGSTPAYVALGGALQHMGSYAAAHPYERSVVVFVTDGLPNRCDSDWNDIAGLADYAYRSYGVVTYTIGVDTADGGPLLELIAQKGGGQAFMVSATESGTSSEFIRALLAIRANTASCDLVFDSSKPIDPQNVSVIYTAGGSANPQNLPQVTSQANCGQGWYFDNPTSPSKVTLCPTTCQMIKDDTQAQVELEVGCPRVYLPMDYTQVYSGDCGPSQRVQWGFFSYESTTPADSSIVFQARVSDDPEHFQIPATPEESVTLAVAHGDVSPFQGNTQVCSLTGQGGSTCPVDLYNALGGMTQAQKLYLELRMTLNPSSNSNQPPILSGWKVTHTCVDSE